MLPSASTSITAPGSSGAEPTVSTSVASTKRRSSPTHRRSVAWLVPIAGADSTATPASIDGSGPPEDLEGDEPVVDVDQRDGQRPARAREVALVQPGVGLAGRQRQLGAVVLALGLRDHLDHR